MRVPPWVKGSLVLALTLAAGVAIGIGYERRRVVSHQAETPGSHHMLQRLKTELQLDSAQTRAVEAILTRRQGSVDSTWHAIRPHVHAMLDSTLQEIVRILRPDQEAKYRRLMEGKHPNTLHDHSPR